MKVSGDVTLITTFISEDYKKIDEQNEYKLVFQSCKI